MITSCVHLCVVVVLVVALLFPPPSVKRSFLGFYSTSGPRRSNLVYPTMAVAHEGLASLAVDLHEVGDLLALTNSLVQLHNLVGGSQVTPSQSRRHHSPRSNKWCVGNELLALVLQMIVSPTLNSLS